MLYLLYFKSKDLIIISMKTKRQLRFPSTPLNCESFVVKEIN